MNAESTFVASFRIPHTVKDRIETALLASGLHMSANQCIREHVIADFLSISTQQASRLEAPSLTPAQMKRLIAKAKRQAASEETRRRLETMRISIHQEIDDKPRLTFCNVFDEQGQ